MKVKKTYAILITLVTIFCFNPLAEAARGGNGGGGGGGDSINPPEIVSASNIGGVIYIVGNDLCPGGVAPTITLGDYLVGGGMFPVSCGPDVCKGSDVCGLAETYPDAPPPGTYNLFVTTDGGTDKIAYTPTQTAAPIKIYRVERTWPKATVAIVGCEIGDTLISGFCSGWTEGPYTQGMEYSGADDRPYAFACRFSSIQTYATAEALCVDNGSGRGLWTINPQ